MTFNITVVSYLGKGELKTAFLAQLTRHEEQDALIKGTYGRKNGMFQGCAIGCSLHSLNILQGKIGAALTEQTNRHDRYPTELGWPVWLAYLEDLIFEYLPDTLATSWPRRLAEAIPVGAVIDDSVLLKILQWELADATFGARFATDSEVIRRRIDGVIAGLNAQIARGGQASSEQREVIAIASRDAWDAWAGTKALAFFPALAEYVLSILRELPVSKRWLRQQDRLTHLEF